MSTRRPMRDLTMIVAAIAMGSIVLVLSLRYGGPNSASDERVGGLAVGKSVPVIAATGWLHGEAPTQESLEGKVTVIHTWASW